MTWLMQRIADRRTQRRCFHHNHSTGKSWISGRIIDYRKLWDCTRCGKTWVI